jgi:hypothetical protein
MTDAPAAPHGFELIQLPDRSVVYFENGFQTADDARDRALHLCLHDDRFNNAATLYRLVEVHDA